MHYSRLVTVFALVCLAIMSRLLPHPPNFTAIIAVAVFSAFTLRQFALSCCIVYSAMLICDLIIGNHSQMLFVYFSLGVILSLNYFRFTPLISLLFSPFIFFFIVNFGVWLIDGFYPHTLSGLGLSYLAALPFLSNQLISTYLFGFVLFNSFNLFEKHIPALRACEGSLN